MSIQTVLKTKKCRPKPLLDVFNALRGKIITKISYDEGNNVPEFDFVINNYWLNSKYAVSIYFPYIECTGIYTLKKFHMFYENKEYDCINLATKEYTECRDELYKIANDVYIEIIEQKNTEYEKICQKINDSLKVLDVWDIIIIICVMLRVYESIIMNKHKIL